ncbi:MAG TPA: RNA-binding domain-containing protein, partial [Candidatus Nanoarchaeia archaeon]|nr:RNA-binding domain-containing protein [Candidatus Nanoarchaeia archaeon]
MEYNEILKEIKNPEKEVIELKRSFSEWEEIAKTIASFSTKSGGKIFVGVDKTGCPIGTICNSEIKGRIQGVANNEI